MSKFQFTTNEEVEEYCDEIVEIMVHNFDISAREAINRINENWKGQTIEDAGSIGYEWPMYWAFHIYYEPHNQWWIQGEEREKSNLPPLKVKPLP